MYYVFRHLFLKLKYNFKFLKVSDININPIICKNKKIFNAKYLKKFGLIINNYKLNI